MKLPAHLTRLLAALSFLLLLATFSRAAEDRYWPWAAAHFGHAIASDPAQKAAVWGETADPERDGLPNLLEYAADTDPLARTPLSAISTYQPTPGPALTSHPVLTAWQRTDDPDLRFVCQSSADLTAWFPAFPLDLTQPMPAYTGFTATETGTPRSALRQMRYQELSPIGTRPAAFLRLSVIRRNTVATSPGLEPFAFTSQPAIRASANGTPSEVRSNTITLAGFTGTLTIVIPAGVTLFVNGIAQTGTTAVVKAGDALWMQATAPTLAGLSRNYTLTIGGLSSTWSFSTASLVADSHIYPESGQPPPIWAAKLQSLPVVARR